MLTTIITPAGVNIHIPGMGMKAVGVKSPFYDDVISIIMDGLDLPEDQQLTDNEKIHRILRVIDRATALKDTISSDITISGGNVQIDGEFVPAVISKRLVDFTEQKYNTDPIVKFWRNLRNNPDERSRVELLAFLEHCGIPITEDGCFVAYKYVESDYSASHDKSYKNHPGNELYKERSDCDSDSTHTCSNGLHVAAWGYVKNRSTIVAVKVNPVDVVSIPYDYNGQKMRVCRYVVIEKIAKEFTESRYEPTTKVELDRATFQHLGIVGNHKSHPQGMWSGTITHKNALLNGVTYKGDSLEELHDNFIKTIDQITADTRFNYLRIKRDANGGFLKKDSK